MQYFLRRLPPAGTYHEKTKNDRRTTAKFLILPQPFNRSAEDSELAQVATSRRRFEEETPLVRPIYDPEGTPESTENRKYLSVLLQHCLQELGGVEVEVAPRFPAIRRLQHTCKKDVET